jgi:peptidoglycan/xylan/chitin deacetylase (PgdA/CDA1 family)
VFTDYKPKLLILLYHRVLPEVRFDPINITMTKKTFVKQLDVLTKRYHTISLTDAINQCQRGNVKAKNQVVLTFDDGYWDNYEIVFPILEKRGIPATFFLATNYINKHTPLWDWEIITLLLRRCTDIQSIKINSETLKQGVFESRLSFALRTVEKMKSINTETIQDIINSLKNHIDNKYNDSTEDICMTWEQVERMSQFGMEIGAHSVTHRSLSKISNEGVVHEIEKSKEAIEQRIQKSCIHFAFPFGKQRDCKYGLIDQFKKTGFQSCLLNIQGYNHIKPESFYFKRIAMKESSSLDFLFG